MSGEWFQRAIIDRIVIGDGDDPMLARRRDAVDVFGWVAVAAAEKSACRRRGRMGVHVKIVAQAFIQWSGFSSMICKVAEPRLGTGRESSC